MLSWWELNEFWLWPLTRPDISFLENKLSQFLHAPTITHLQAVKRLIWYLKDMTHLGLFFSPCSFQSIMCYTDADWANCPDGRRSTSGFCHLLGPNLICWKSSKQHVIPRSSAEACRMSLLKLYWLSFASLWQYYRNLHGSQFGFAQWVKTHRSPSPFHPRTCPMKAIGG